MKNLTSYEVCFIAGGAAMEQDGENIIITVGYGETFLFGECYFTWIGAYTAGDEVIVQQGEMHNGYHIHYSMGSNAIARYSLTR